MSSSLAPVGTPERLRQVEYKAERTGKILLLCALLLIAFNVVYSVLIYQASIRVSRLIIHVSEPEVVGTDAVCPGEFLVYDYVINSSEAQSVIEFDATIWSADREQTTIYSSPFRLILLDQKSASIRESWQIPHDQALTRQIAVWQPGLYERRLAFRNLYQRETPAIVRVPFSIREDCPNE